MNRASRLRRDVLAITTLDCWRETRMAVSPRRTEPSGDRQGRLKETCALCAILVFDISNYQTKHGELVLLDYLPEDIVIERVVGVSDSVPELLGICKTVTVSSNPLLDGNFIWQVRDHIDGVAQPKRYPIKELF